VTLLASVGPSIAFTAEFAITTVRLTLGAAAINPKLAPFNITEAWTEQIGLLINDAVVIWRAWVLYSDKPIVLFSLCLTFSATLATSFASLVLISRVISVQATANDVSSSGIATQASMADILNTAATSLSLATNLFATSLIFFQLWKHRRFNHRFGLHSLTSSQRIMLLLVEAGFIFCIGQAFDLFVGIYFDANPNITLAASYALQIIDDTFWASLPLYLPAVILLAANNRTMTETFGFGSNLMADAAHPEVAAREEGGPESSTDSPETAQISAHEGNDDH